MQQVQWIWRNFPWQPEEGATGYGAAAVSTIGKNGSISKAVHLSLFQARETVHLQRLWR
jgi:hypothetical protein